MILRSCALVAVLCLTQSCTFHTGALSLSPQYPVYSIYGLDKEHNLNNSLEYVPDGLVLKYNFSYTIEELR
jgi:hypothetical protein